MSKTTILNRDSFKIFMIDKIHEPILVIRKILSKSWFGNTLPASKHFYTGSLGIDNVIEAIILTIVRWSQLFYNAPDTRTACTVSIDSG